MSAIRADARPYSSRRMPCSGQAAAAGGAAHPGSGRGALWQRPARRTRRGPAFRPGRRGGRRRGHPDGAPPPLRPACRGAGRPSGRPACQRLPLALPPEASTAVRHAREPCRCGAIVSRTDAAQVSPVVAVVLPGAPAPALALAPGAAAGAVAAGAQPPATAAAGPMPGASGPGLDGPVHRPHTRRPLPLAPPQQRRAPQQAALSSGPTVHAQVRRCS